MLFRGREIVAGRTYRKMATLVFIQDATKD